MEQEVQSAKFFVISCEQESSKDDENGAVVKMKSGKIAVVLEKS